MKPEYRATRRVIETKEKPKPKPPVKKRKPNVTKVNDERWLLTEKKTLLSILQQLENPRLPDDLSQIQRHIPRRSCAEIEAYLNTLVQPAVDKSEAAREEFAETNVKKWLNCCDRSAGISATCSNVGDGIVETPHPALVMSEIFSGVSHSEIITSNGADSTEFDCEGVYWFIEQLLKGNDPFEEWTCKRKLDSAMLIEVLHEIQTDVSLSILDRQHEFFFHKYRESTGAACKELDEDPVPNDVFDSRLLNPLNLSKELGQSVRRRFEGPLFHYKKVMTEGQLVVL